MLSFHQKVMFAVKRASSSCQNWQVQSLRRTMFSSSTLAMKGKPKFTEIGKVMLDRTEGQHMREGEFFIHTAGGCRAVVLRVDSTFANSQNQTNTDYTDVEKKQTFYLALPDERDYVPTPSTKTSIMIYAPQSEVFPYYSYIPLQHPHSSTYMKGFANGRHEIHSDFYCLF
eukprot:CFRG2443T1